MQVSGLETDLAKLWQAVESLGGIEQVIDRHRWKKVVEMLKIPKIVSYLHALVLLNFTYPVARPYSSFIFVTFPF